MSMMKLFTEDALFSFKLCMIPKKLTGFPLNNFCVNHEVNGIFQNLKYAHKIPVLVCQMGIVNI